MITLVHNNLIWYTYKGDEIAWDGVGYISLCSEVDFSSLNEMDTFWNDYFKEMSK